MHRKNNFDFLRLIFASFVIITHSYPLSGSSDSDWLSQTIHPVLTFAYLGVKGFFIISGYLIYQSFARSKNIVDYYWKRFLRLYPALTVMLLLTVLLAPFVYDGTLNEYLKNGSAWSYLPKNLSIFLGQASIDGVFTSNAYPNIINGSLWTIRYEVALYMIISLLFLFRRWNPLPQILVAVAFTLLLIGNVFFFNFLSKFAYIISGTHLLDLGVFFIGGSLLAAFNFETMKYQEWLGYFALFILLISFPAGFFDEAKYIVLPIVVIFFGLKSTPVINNIGNQIGDVSYGIYIYGFPVQQTLMYFFKPNTFSLMFFSWVIAFTLAYASWHLIEARALKYKNYSNLKLFRIIK